MLVGVNCEKLKGPLNTEFQETSIKDTYCLQKDQHNRFDGSSPLLLCWGLLEHLAYLFFYVNVSPYHATKNSQDFCVAHLIFCRTIIGNHASLQYMVHTELDIVYSR